jgi:hypothetical protein
MTDTEERPVLRAMLNRHAKLFAPMAIAHRHGAVAA